jgi:aerobic C4-dicarboxylate transport protein
VNVTRPGAGIDTAAVAAAGGGAEAVGRYAAAGEKLNVVDFLVHVVPTSVVGAFAEGEVLQVVLFSVLFGAALGAAGPAAAPLVGTFERLAAVFFRLVAMIMTLAPVGAFGAMAYTVGAFGLRTLLPLGRLMADVYLTMAVFVFGVLGVVCRLWGFRLWEFLRYIRDEIVLVVGTSSSESALPRMLEKLERYGCARSVVGAGGAGGVLVQPRRHVRSTCRWPRCSSRRPTASTSRSASSSRCSACSWSRARARRA